MVEGETNPLRPAPTSRSDIPSVVPDATIILAVMRSIVGPILRMDGLPVLNILEKLRKSVPGFMYRYLLDKDGQLAGWCYSTPRQRAALEDSGHIIFADFKAKGTNKYGWPYFSGGPHIRRSFTGGFKGNTMGEVPFAAVLHWVTRIDDFKMLLEDLTERERTVHLA